MTQPICPACEKALTTQTTRNLSLQVCSDGCGGVWFDKGEIENFDDSADNAPLAITRPLANKQVVIDENKTRQCPRCFGTALERFFFDGQASVELDHCPSCEGIWLDLGELDLYREEKEGNLNREEIFKTFLKRIAEEQKNDTISRRYDALVKLIF